MPDRNSLLLHEADQPITVEECITDLDEQKTLDRIRHYIGHPPENSRMMTITSKICPELLKYNRNNRPEKPKKIAEYANYMMADEWMLTGDTIKFSNAKRRIAGTFPGLAADPVLQWPADGRSIEAGEFRVERLLQARTDNFAVLDALGHDDGLGE